jgi:S1-C subfamily serine protease
MRKLLFLSIGTLLMLSSIFCCVSFTPRLNIQKVFPRQSFLFVEKDTIFFQCGKLQCKRVHKGGMTGSASVIYHNKKRSFILTAAHLVYMKPIDFFKKMKLEEDGELKTVDIWTLTDVKGKKYKNIKVLSWDRKTDIAILSIKRINLPALHIAAVPPKIGDKLYNVGAPHGLFSKNLVLFYEGRFIGYLKNKIMMDTTARVAITSIPVAGGSSGSPILDKDGDIVGMVSAMDPGFHHISMSPTWKQIHDFTDKHLLKHGYGFRPTPKEPTSKPSGKPRLRK